MESEIKRNCLKVELYRVSAPLTPPNMSLNQDGFFHHPRKMASCRQVLHLSQVSWFLTFSRGQSMVFLFVCCVFLFCFVYFLSKKDDSQSSISEAAASSAMSYLASGSE